MKCPKCQTDNTDTARFCSNCAAPLSSAEDARPSFTKTLETTVEDFTRGTLFAERYEIIEELGVGGMGAVYRVEDTKAKEEIAIKLIKPEIAADIKTIERFRNELTTARKIRHKNICGMYDLNEEKGTHYITMEYVPGEDLKGFLRRSGHLTVSKALSIAKQVCDGLSEAHGLGIVHRDLKPSNIIIDKEGNARIMDFGIARSLKTKGATGAGVVIGTPEYMSPEQAEAKNVDFRSDIYSLGVMLYEMVTGQLPFKGDTPLSTAMKHKNEVPDSPNKYNTQIPDDINQLILKCLEKDKEDRYRSTAELAAELGNYIKSIQTTDREIPKRKPITSKEITVTFGLRRLVIPVLIFIAAVIIGLVVWQLILEKGPDLRATEKHAIAVLPFEDFSPQKDQEYLCDGMTDEIITKLSSLQGWKVMNMSSVMRYKHQDKDIEEIGRELDVSTILSGRVRKEKDEVRVTAQLVNVEDGFQLWAETYEQTLDGVFAIQDDVAEKIALALEATLSPEDRDRLEKRPTEDIEAYNLYLQGRWFLNKRKLDDFKKATEYFERAIGRDPGYARAYVGIADSYTLLSNYYGSPKINYPKAEAAVLKALEIDDRLAEAHTSLAYIKMNYYYDMAGAEEEYKLSLKLNPNERRTHHWYALCLGFMARFNEAYEELNLGREIDPSFIGSHRDVGYIYYLAGEYDQAIEALQKAIEMSPNTHGSHWYLAQIFMQKSMYNEALKEFQLEQNINYRPWVELNMGILYALMGNIDGTKRLLKKFEGADELLGFHSSIALIQFSLGEVDLGFVWLDKAFEARDLQLRALKVDPLFDDIRADPRFKAFLKKIGME